MTTGVNPDQFTFNITRAAFFSTVSAVFWCDGQNEKSFKCKTLVNDYNFSPWSPSLYQLLTFFLFSLASPFLSLSFSLSVPRLRLHLLPPLFSHTSVLFRLLVCSVTNNPLSVNTQQPFPMLFTSVSTINNHRLGREKYLWKEMQSRYPQEKECSQRPQRMFIRDL